MIVVSLDNVTFGYGARTVLSGLSWQIQAGQKIGLVGPNGAGKSTVLRLIVGELTPEAGGIVRARESRIGYLAQEPILDAKHTVWDEVLAAATELSAVQAELRHLEQRMADPQVYGDEGALSRAMAAYARAQAALEGMDGYAHEGRVRETLHVLGFDNGSLDQPVGALSGGERSRLQLAMLMLSGCNFLLLDEPTNNLDLPSAEVLEGALGEFEGTVLVVSHDRYFLDRVVERIVELEEGTLVEYPGDYSYYREHKNRG